MATEKRLLDDLDAQSSGAWTNESNAFTEDDNYAESSTLAVGLYAGGDYQQITQTPTGFSEFKVAFFDLNSTHVNDTYELRYYNNHISTWALLETFNSGNLLPAPLTPPKNYSSQLITAYNVASDKTAFLNNLGFRITNTAKQAGPDNVQIGLAWSYFTYTYTEAAGGTFSPIGFKYSPQAPVSTSDASGTATAVNKNYVGRTVAGSADISASVGTIGFQKEVKAPVSISAIVAGVTPKSFQFAVVSPAGAAGPVSGSPSPIGFQFDVKAIVSTSAIVVSVASKTFQKEVKAPVSTSDITVDVAPKTFQFEVIAPDSGAAGSQVAPIDFNLIGKSSVGSASATADVTAVAFNLEVNTPVGSAGITVNVAATEFKVTAKAPVSTSDITADVAPKAFQFEVLAPDSGAVGSQVAPINFNLTAKSSVGAADIVVNVSAVELKMTVKAPVSSSAAVADVAPVSLELSARSQAGSASITAAISPKSSQYSVITPAGSSVGAPRTNWYVAGVSGDNVTGDGSPEKPFKTMAPFNEISGDTVHFQENCPFQINVVSGATYQQWSGETQAVIDGEATRANCIFAGTKIDFTLDGLHFTDAVQYGIRVASVTTGTVTINNCEGYLNGITNFLIQDTSGGTINITDCKGYLAASQKGCYILTASGGTINVTDSDFYSNNGNGLVIQTISGTASITVDGCNCYDQTLLHGIYVNGVTGGTIALTNNNCYSNAQHGIHILTVSAGAITGDGNACYSNGQHGLYVRGVTGGDFDVKRNTIRENTLNGFYARSVDADSFIVQFNLFYKNSVTASNRNIFLFSSSLNIELYRNTIYGRKSSDYGIRIEADCTGSVLKGNIVAHCRVGILGAAGSGPTIDYSNIYDCTIATEVDATTAWAAGTGNITTDPKFIDTATDNYNIEDDSPCKEGGVVLVGASATDILGNTAIVGDFPDIGCYENTSEIIISCPGLVGKIYKIIERFGKEIDFKKERSRAYDPSTGIGGIETVLVKRKITPPEIKRKYIKNDKVVAGEVEFYLSACELIFDPKPGLGIIIDGEEWEISKRQKIRDTSALNVYKITAKR